MAKAEFYSVKLLAKQMIARAVLALHFEKPQGFVFQAGQFVQFKVPTADGAVVIRNFSLAAPPAAPDLEFCAKMIPGGKASDWFTSLPVGEGAEISAARGVFVCSGKEERPKVLVATGVGLAPIISILEDAVPRAPATPFRLLWGVRSAADLFWPGRLPALAERHQNFSFLITLSQPAGNWGGERGRVTERLPGLITPGADYYLCGSLAMVKEARSMILDQGIALPRIKIEIF
ncbi:MAG: hypothetical protein HYV42_00890 [Candidatus Magasanikbacteria bacterium]|nr:hypothetical protein [Candidatus Magasanikbacteria bacterium]